MSKLSRSYTHEFKEEKKKLSQGVKSAIHNSNYNYKIAVSQKIAHLHITDNITALNTAKNILA